MKLLAAALAVWLFPALSMGNKFELANHDGLIVGGRLLETPQIDTHRGSDLGNVRCV